ATESGQMSGNHRPAAGRAIGTLAVLVVALSVATENPRPAHAQGPVEAPSNLAPRRKERPKVPALSEESPALSEESKEQPSELPNRDASNGATLFFPGLPLPIVGPKNGDNRRPADALPSANSAGL